MPMTPQIAALRIARSIGQAEAQADDLLISLARLQIDLLTARREADVPVHTGQKAIMRLIAAQDCVVRGQNDVFRIHDSVADIARERGLMDERGLTEGSGLSDFEDAAQAA
jgi:hypothetical protein